MPKDTTTTSTQPKDEAALARAKARREAAEAAKSTLPPAQKGRLAWDKERTRELFRLYKENGDLTARDELVTNHLNLVRFLAAKFKNRGESMEDLIQVGTIGLINAIDRFDPDQGNEFTTLATPTIMGEIRRHFRDKGWSVHVPRRLQENSAKVTKAIETLTSDLQHSPSTQEVAEYLGLSVEEVLEAMEASGAYSAISLDVSNSDDEDAPPIMDKLMSEEDDFQASDDRIVLADVIKDFSPREQEVINMRYREGLTQVEIAEKLGISQVQVSRLLRRTLQKIRLKLEPESMVTS